MAAGLVGRCAARPGRRGVREGEVVGERSAQVNLLATPRGQARVLNVARPPTTPHPNSLEAARATASAVLPGGCCGGDSRVGPRRHVALRVDAAAAAARGRARGSLYMEEEEMTAPALYKAPPSLTMLMGCRMGKIVRSPGPCVGPQSTHAHTPRGQTGRGIEQRHAAALRRAAAWQITARSARAGENRQWRRAEHAPPSQAARQGTGCSLESPKHQPNQGEWPAPGHAPCCPAYGCPPNLGTAPGDVVNIPFWPFRADPFGRGQRV